MKRPGYREAVQWIAYNDDAGGPDAFNPSAVSGLVSTCLVADLFGVEQEKVGADIVRYRQRHKKEIYHGRPPAG